MKNKIRIGTRGSQLALWQANWIETLVAKSDPDVEIERVVIKTEGDRDQSSSLARIGGLGVFTKAIEEALLQNRVDIAVHSLKDLPSAMTERLILAAVPPRGAVEDVLVTTDGRSFSQLNRGARIATGSIRRRSQLLHLRPDLVITDLRGNINTRLKKLIVENLDGIIMARAAIERLELKNVRYYTFPVSEMVPGVGQGAVGVQIRADDYISGKITAAIDHAPTRRAVTAERAFLHELDSGCQFPVGAHASLKKNVLSLNGFVGSENGKEILLHSLEGETGTEANLGVSLANYFIDRGARTILEGTYAE